MYGLQNLDLCIDHVNEHPLIQEKHEDVRGQKKQIQLRKYLKPELQTMYDSISNCPNTTTLNFSKYHSQ